MNVPAVAKKTFDQLKLIPEFLNIVNKVSKFLLKQPDAIKRARHVHDLIDTYNNEVFSHPLVRQLSPCKQGCSACCHTQVSVTEDEAALLMTHIENGLVIDNERLKLQMNAENDSGKFYQLSYQDRKCVFLDEKGNCRVYHDRPSVCRTNAVIGEASQCDTSQSIKPTRLVLTQKADMAIYASFRGSKSSGALPFMLGNAILKSESKVS